MTADRNLLFGILALQLNFVTRDQLVEGMHAWVLDKSGSLGGIFVQQRAMDREQQLLLEALVDKHVEKHAGNIQKSIQQVHSVDPFTTKLLAEIGDEDLQRTVMELPFDPFATTISVEAPKRASSRFRIIRPHARGGLGEVFLAHDAELSREVAVKEIQERYADNSDSRVRFLREAEITGRLEHPGIVPVYGLGTYDDGRPFYAMRFIRGQSLDYKIEQFHGGKKFSSEPHETHGDGNHSIGDLPNNVDQRALAFRRLLQTFIDVCDAVHFAHSRGVLHRDLKPGNVMVGRYGETLVVDWGLAKLFGKEATSERAESVISIESQSGTAATIMGTTLGTPAYMSPEQAAGKIDTLGPTSDVYSLGATLYVILTGKSPFSQSMNHQRDATDIIEKVKRGEFRKPHELNRNVPKSLEAICMKAMEKNTASRYQSARELAAEVERYLADEPVEALQETFLTRAARLARRHRSIILASSLSLLAITFISMIAFLVVNEQRKANAQLAEANGQLAKEKGDLAEKNELLFQSERESKNAARKAATETGTLASTLSLDKGIDWMNRGDLDIAAHWFAKAYELPTDEYSSSGRVACKNLNVCLESLHKLERVLFDAEPLLAVVHAPNPDAIITCSLHGVVRQLSLADGTWSSLCQVGNDELSVVAISPRSNLVATIDKAGKFQLWNSQTGDRVEDGRSDVSESASALAFSPDGQILAVAFSKGVRIWQCNSKSWQDQQVPTDFYVGSIAFDPEGSYLVMGFHKTKVWSLIQQKWLGDLDVGHTCMGVAVDGDGSSILVARWMEAKLFRWRGDSVQETTIQKHGITFVTSVSFNKSSTMFCATGADGLATVWDVESGKRLAQPLRHTLQGLQGSLFSKDGRRLITYGGLEQGKAELRIWRVSDRSRGDFVLRHNTAIVSAAYSNDGKLIAFFDDKSRNYVVERSSGRILSGPLTHKALQYSGPEPCSSLSFLRDNQLLCSTSMSGGVCLWDWRNSKLFIEPLDNGECVDSPNVNSVRDSCFSDDEKHLIVSGGLSGVQGYVRAYDWMSGRKVIEFLAPGSRVHCVASVPGENSVLFGGDLRNARLLSLDSNASHTDPIEHPGALYSIAFADHGRTLLAGYFQDTAYSWDFKKKTMNGAPLDHRGYVRKIAVNNDNSEFVTSDGLHLRRWDLETQNAIGPPIPIPNFHNGIAFAPDGSEALAGYPDGSLRAFIVPTAGALTRNTIRNEIAVVTGIHVYDTGAVRVLTESEWTIAHLEAHGISSSLNESMPAIKSTPQGKFQRQLYFGDVYDAVATAESWYASATEQPQALYRAAGMFAECARKIKGMREIMSESKPSLLAQVQKYAVQALQEAIRAGYVPEISERFAQEFEGVRDLNEFQQIFHGPFASVQLRALGQDAQHLDLAYTRQDNRVCIANMGSGTAQLWNFDHVDTGWLDWVNDGQELIVRQGSRFLGFDPRNPGSRRVYLDLASSAQLSSVNPKGSHTAFECTKAYKVPRVILMDNHTRKETLLAQFGYDPCWSLDGKTLALFDVSDTSGTGVIQLLDTKGLIDNSDSTESATLLPKPKATLVFPYPHYGQVHPALSADGGLVAFGMKGDDGTRQIGLSTVETLQVRQLTRNGKDNTFPAFSPDGRYLAYIRNTHAPFELVVWDLKKDEETIIADEVAFGRPAWRERSGSK